MNSNSTSFDGETSSSGILWTEILCRIPFIKNAEVRTDEKFQIDSKNEVEEEDALQLENCIQNQEVILSHTWPTETHQHCRGVVEDFEYQEKNLKVTVSSTTGFPIWEDTDIWMYSLSTPASSSHNTEPNTSTESDHHQEEVTTKPDEEVEQEELFRSIHGWKLIRERRERKRRKFGEKWKNVYLTELEMTTVDPIKEKSLMHVKEGISLRLSNDIEELGDVLVDVVRKSCTEGLQYTITLGVTGFLRTDVDIILSKESTYYLNIYDDENEELGSVASEPYVLPGYPLEQNIDELCEKVGQLTITDICVKTWLNPFRSLPYIRLLVASERKMHHFKLLVGHHVIIQSPNHSQETLLAVVNRVLRDEMVLTLKGIPSHGREFFFSKTERFTIRIDHCYEESLLALSGREAELETLRQNFLSKGADIRLHRKWKDMSGPVRKSYATFTSKNEAFSRIPINTRVLLGKCYEVEGRLEKKAEFVFAIRVDDSICNSTTTINKVTFEIKYCRNLIEGSDEFDLSTAYYYVEFDSSREILQNSNYRLLNARNVNEPRSNAVTNMCFLHESLKFLVFPLGFEDRGDSKRYRRPYTQNSSGNTSDNNNQKELHFSNQKYGATTPWSKPVVVPKRDPPQPIQKVEQVRDIHMEKLALNTLITSNEPWKVLQQIDEKHKRLCYVYLTRYKNDKDNVQLTIQTGYDEKGQVIKTAPLQLGHRLFLTSNTDSKEIKVTGDVQDTNKGNVTLLVDKKSSDMDFIKKMCSESKKQRQLLTCYA